MGVISDVEGLNIPKVGRGGAFSSSCFLFLDCLNYHLGGVSYHTILAVSSFNYIEERITKSLPMRPYLGDFEARDRRCVSVAVSRWLWR